MSGFNGAEYKSFEDHRQAEEALRGTFEDYKGKRTTTLSPEALAIIGDPIADSYCVDAACTGNPGPMEYRCVHTSTRKQLFHQGPFENGSNNIGEFLAIVHALALFKQRGVTAPIYSDSETALSWVKKQHCKTKLIKDESNTEIFDLIARAENWLTENSYDNPLLKWNTNAWGEIPADFGRK